MSGINTPIHLIRKRSKDHIHETRRTLERFCLALRDANYDIDTLSLNNIKQDEIGIFCSYILNGLGLASYNKPCVIMKSFFNWCITVKDWYGKNPFIKIQLSIGARKEKNSITQEEFAELLNVITPENGIGLRGDKKVNHYHPWLSVAFRLALETGLRAEEVVTLKFSNIKEIKKGVLAIKLVNLKVWRAKTGSDVKQVDKYVKYVPITASLLALLEEQGYQKLSVVDKRIIPIPENISLNFSQDIISRAFTHFIKLVTPRKIEYKDLRKTYITHLTMALGDKTKLFTGHSDDAVLQNHYLADSVLMSGLSNLNIFGKSA